MTGETDARDRKAEHLDLARQDRMQLRGRHFDRFVLPHRALPEMAMEEVDPGVDFLGRRLGAPLLISCMTGGTGEAERINENLAWAAERRHIALGVGSQRKALEDPTQIRSFQVRRAAPSVPLLANLGAVQLNYGFGVEECRAAVDMIDADALVFHLNPLQEALQPEGQTDFGGLLEQMGRVARELQVPVVAKEVGNGISAEMARALMEQGITVVDTAGRGGRAGRASRRADRVTWRWVRCSPTGGSPRPRRFGISPVSKASPSSGAAESVPGWTWPRGWRWVPRSWAWPSPS